MVKAHFLTDSLLTKHRTDSVGVIARAEARGDPVKLVASSTGLPRRLPSARNDIVVPTIPNRGDKARPPPPRANCYILLFFHLSILSFCCVGLASPNLLGSSIWSLRPIALLPYLLIAFFIMYHVLRLVKRYKKK